MIICSCGNECVDHEEWINHVRRNMPQPNRNRKRNARLITEERVSLLAYIEKHKVIKSEILSKEEVTV